MANLKSDKMIRKDVRFGYFNIKISKKHLAQEVSRYKKEVRTEKTRQKYNHRLELIKEIEEKSEANLVVNFEQVFKALKEGKIKNTYDMYNKTIEIDKLTFMPQKVDANNKDFIFFQIVSPRISNPTKKKIGQKRKAITLEDNEFIGEFTSILYNKKTRVLMVQHNRHSLTINRVALLLSLMFKEYMEIGNDEKYPLILLDLDTALDPEQLKKINKKSCYSSIKISGNPVVMSSVVNEGKATYGIDTILTAFQGYDFVFDIRGKKNKKTYKSLDQIQIEDLYKKYAKAKKSHAKDDLPNITVRLQENENAPKEVINWFLPKMESSIIFHIEPNKVLSHEIVYDKMFEGYNKKSSKLESTLTPLDNGDS